MNTDLYKQYVWYCPKCGALNTMESPHDWAECCACCASVELTERDYD